MILPVTSSGKDLGTADALRRWHGLFALGVPLHQLSNVRRRWCGLLPEYMHGRFPAGVWSQVLRDEHGQVVAVQQRHHAHAPNRSRARVRACVERPTAVALRVESRAVQGCGAVLRRRVHSIDLFLRVRLLIADLNVGGDECGWIGRVGLRMLM